MCYYHPVVTINSVVTLLCLLVVLLVKVNVYKENIIPNRCIVILS